MTGLSNCLLRLDQIGTHSLVRAPSEDRKRYLLVLVNRTNLLGVHKFLVTFRKCLLIPLPIEGTTSLEMEARGIDVEKRLGKTAVVSETCMVQLFYQQIQQDPTVRKYCSNNQEEISWSTIQQIQHGAYCPKLFRPFSLAIFKMFVFLRNKTQKISQ